ncbi:MAG: response regulator [Dehalococcoidia bacterium]|nr:response regulator [Dehalococcoidia bacterium]
MGPSWENKQAKVLAVDASRENLELIQALLSVDGYQVITASNGAEALVMVEKESPDLILVDATMPKMDGFEVCAVLKSKEETRLIPVLLVTPIEETEHKIRGFEAGVDDFLHRPINSVELLARVKCLVRTKRLNDELVNVENAIIALATAIEAKDPYTEGHVERVASYALTLGKEVRLAPWELRALHKAAILHDVGKIGVDESILLKPGSLTEEEFNQLKTHTIIGERICRPLGRNRLILEVIRHHHERYDGKGYPDGLAGEDIPIAARIMAVVDAYDALTSDRPYRARRSQEQAVEILKQEAGKQFDPKIATAFISLLETGRLR